MPPPTKDKAKSKKFTTCFSPFFRRKVASGRLNDVSSDSTARVPPNIVVQGESSGVPESHRDTRSATTGALPRENQNMTSSEHEAPDVSSNESSGYFHHAHDFVVFNPTIVDKPTINYHIASDREVKAKELLLKHIIAGAGHDSSARDPPPRCHPGTRIKINDRIMTWFYDEEKEELVLWIHGPAGVGKSAIAQTIADALALANCLGASVFFSRPNGRNNSRSVFNTIAYQLAVHIEAYCTFISGKLASDPELVNKSMKEQFRAFIVEPFVDMKIGAGGKTWGILLDGLDELDDRHWQREIIRLITAFALEHPNVPLAFLIASRPEPHIVDTFKTPQIVSSFWEEHVPIDSPEACQDVERYLRSSFDTIREDFPRIVPSNWPDEIQVVRLASAASGLFAFAEVAIRFIENPYHADPVTRLQRVLSAIDGSSVNSSDNQPFARLDALYTYIVSCISPEIWPTTKRVLGALSEGMGLGLTCVKGVSVVLDLRLSEVYTSVNDLYSVIDIPLNDVNKSMWFHHTSFVDFLRDSTRSKQFSAPLGEAERDVNECFLRIYTDFKGEYPEGPSAKYTNRWLKYSSRFHSNDNLSANTYDEFDASVFHKANGALLKYLRRHWDLIQKEAFEHHWEQFCGLVSEVDAAVACHGELTPWFFVHFFFDIWKALHDRDRLSNAGIVREVQLEHLKFDHLQWPNEIATHAIWGSRSAVYTKKSDSYQSFNEHMSGLEYIQRHHPKLTVLICGASRHPFAVFIYKYSERDFKEHQFHIEVEVLNFHENEYHGYYCIPLPNAS